MGSATNFQSGSDPDTAMTSEAPSLSPISRIRIKNRRKRYLDLHPEYFTSANLELAGLPELNDAEVTNL